MKIERYVKSPSIEAAFASLHEGTNNKIIAGGAWLKLTDPTIDTAIDLSLLNLDFITDNGKEIEIGAMTTLHTLGRNAILNKIYDGILSRAAMQIMGITVRNIATIGGCIMGKFGFSDILTPLVAMDALLIFHQHDKMTVVEFLNTKENIRDILVKVVIRKANTRGYFRKIALTHLDFAVLNTAVSRNGSEFRIVFGSRPGVSTRAYKAESFLKEQIKIDEDVMNKAVEIAAAECQFGSNQRGSAEYRQSLAKVYAKRGIKAVTTNEN